MKLNRKFLKKVQREFKPRKSIQYIRECYKNGGIFHETEEFTTKVFRSKDLYKFKPRQNDGTTQSELDWIKLWSQVPYPPSNYLVSSQSSQITTMDELVRTFEQVKKQETPFHVPFIYQNNHPIFVIQIHDTIRIDLTKVVNLRRYNSSTL